MRELLLNAWKANPAFGYEIVAQGGTGQEAVDLCLEHQPDLLVLDVVLPGFNGVEALRRLRKQMRGLRVVFFSGCTQEQLIAQAISLGADGYVLKTEPLQALVDAIEAVRRGGKFFDPALAQMSSRLAILPAWQTLTLREQQVARLVAEAKSSKEAAAILGISVKTLDKHRTSMMQKLNLHDAVSVARYAFVTGLASLD
jgi:DNA-binding NarL/FixJ family response regulator